jgi:hypothetical protein
MIIELIRRINVCKYTPKAGADTTRMHPHHFICIFCRRNSKNMQN